MSFPNPINIFDCRKPATTQNGVQIRLSAALYSDLMAFFDICVCVFVNVFAKPFVCANWIRHVKRSIENAVCFFFFTKVIINFYNKYSTFALFNIKLKISTWLIFVWKVFYYFFLFQVLHEASNKGKADYKIVYKMIDKEKM